MSAIYEVHVEFGIGGTGTVGAFRTLEEAEAHRLHLIDFNKASSKPPRYWIVEVDTTGMFTVPSRPAPRERFTTRCTQLSGEREWRRFLVEVLDGGTVVATYERNYDMYDTFEPFRQGDRLLALVSPHYTATSILDLETGEILGGEEPDGEGFCPVGFYVPDWHDVWSESRLPGSSIWTAANEWPIGDFGFVWGTEWGGGGWSVQYLDLTRACEGVIERDERFGSFLLASRPGVPGSEFIHVYRTEQQTSVTFHIQSRFDLLSGKPSP